MSEVGRNLVRHEGENHKNCLDCGFVVDLQVNYCGHCQIKASESESQ